jgi:hypothetical protein
MSGGLLRRLCAFAVGASAGCATGMTYLHGDMYRAHDAVGASVDALAAALDEAAPAAAPASPPAPVSSAIVAAASAEVAAPAGGSAR